MSSVLSHSRIPTGLDLGTNYPTFSQPNNDEGTKMLNSNPSKSQMTKHTEKIKVFKDSHIEVIHVKTSSIHSKDRYSKRTPQLVNELNDHDANSQPMNTKVVSRQCDSRNSEAADKRFVKMVDNVANQTTSSAFKGSDSSQLGIQGQAISNYWSKYTTTQDKWTKLDTLSKKQKKAGSRMMACQSMGDKAIQY